jgi:hypothetical protein
MRALAVSLTALAITSLLLVPVTASRAEPEPPATQEMASSESVIPFETPVGLDQAIELSRDLAGVVGFRFSNGALLGEYRTAVRPAAEFLESFEQNFATQPAIVAVIVENAASKADGGEATREEIPAEISTADLSPYVPDPVANVLDRDTPPAARGSSTASISSGELWKPRVADIEIRRDGALAMVKQSYLWDEGSPGDSPEGFGMEWGVHLYSDLTRSTNPFCPVNYESQYFVMDSRDVETYVYSPNMVDSDAPGFYWDTEVEDECGKRTITVGARYPGQIPESDGSTQLDIYVYGAIGDEDRNRVVGDVSLLDDKGCDDFPWMELNLCMGLRLIDPPDSAENPRFTLGKGRSWYASPELCWTSDDYGRGVPDRWCGSEPEENAVAVTDVQPYVASGSTVGVSISHHGDLDALQEPYLTSLPALGAPRDPNISNRDLIVDVIWWDGFEPVPASSSEPWTLDIDEAAGTVTLANPAVDFDRSRAEVAALFEHSSVTFRAGQMENLNTLTLSGLGRDWDAATVDPYNCAPGDGFASDSVGAYASVTYSADFCIFGTGSQRIPDTGYGTASMTGGSTGYMFSGGWGGPVWIPGSDDTIWAPANGAQVFADYWDPETLTYIPFFEATQNVRDQYVGDWQDVPNFDPLLPLVDATISQYHWTETGMTDENGWDCYYPQAQIPACERWSTSFEFRSSFDSPDTEWGTGWQNFGRNGGQVRFTTSQGALIELVLEPKSFFVGPYVESSGPTPGRNAP